MATQNFHRQLLDNLNTALLLVDRELRVSFINASAQALLELSETRSVGVCIQQLFPHQSDLMAELEAALRDSSPYTSRGFCLTLASGRELRVDLIVTPFQDVADESTALILELQAVDRIMRISREAGLISSQEISQALIRGLAHEIKNPLGGLRGAAQLLARELSDPALEEYTGIIISESDRLRDLVDRMLGPKRQLKPAAVNIHEVLEHVRSLLQAESAEIELRRDYDPSVPEVMADRSQLIQAILNIVRNAMHATSENEGARIIELRSRIQRNFTIGTHRHRLVCRVDIRDNGAGIPEELLQSIFIPMVSGRADGTGLGLSISQSIINQHRGIIECRSESGRTVFTLYLPLGANDA
ncbi:MAG: nitrogen regulation protein NR(II) [Gammaproteobacteria bacterium]|nr:nitrogen regulation protein NR(II) [Gammaproteobacteria bacterium]